MEKFNLDLNSWNLFEIWTFLKFLKDSIKIHGVFENSLNIDGVYWKFYENS